MLESVPESAAADASCRTLPPAPADLAALVGRDLGTSSWIQVDQTRIDDFAQCTGDRQWVHVDPERAARESPYRTTVAHGMLMASLVVPASEEVLRPWLDATMAIHCGIDKLRFHAPVRVSQRVRYALRLEALRAKGPHAVLVTVGVSMEVEGQRRPALDASLVALIVRRHSA